MIRINWSDVEATKNKLLQNGANNSFELIIMILYHKRQECDRVQIRLEDLERALFEIGSNRDVKGIFLYDISLKVPYLKCEEPDQVNDLETVPNSGHPNILIDFNNMSPEARDVWIEIALAQQQHYVAGDTQ